MGELRKISQSSHELQSHPANPCHTSGALLLIFLFQISLWHCYYIKVLFVAVHVTVQAAASLLGMTAQLKIFSFFSEARNTHKQSFFFFFLKKRVPINQKNFFVGTSNFVQ